MRKNATANVKRATNLVALSFSNLQTKQGAIIRQRVGSSILITPQNPLG